MDFQHYLLSRIGVGITNPLWYDYRLPLFRATAYSSIRAQTEKNFTWVIVIDENIPASALAELESLQSDMPCIRLVKVDELNSSSKGLEQVPIDRPVITSRIDDDDAIITTAFEMVHERARKAGTKSLYTFPSGLELDLKGRLYTPHGYPSYAMATYALSPSVREFNVYSVSHAKITEHAQELGIKHHRLNEILPSWIYVRHAQADSNLRKSKSLMELTDTALRTMADTFGLSLTDLAKVFEMQATEGRPSSMPALEGKSFLKAKMDLILEYRRAVGHHKEALEREYRRMTFDIYPRCQECGRVQSQFDVEKHSRICAECAA